MANCFECEKEHSRTRSVVCLKCSKKKYRANLIEKRKQEAEKLCDVCGCKYKLSSCPKCYSRNYTERNREKINLKSKEWKRKFRLSKTGKKKQPNGTGFIDKDGYKYITVKGHPNEKNSNGQIAEHKFVMCQYLGRFLFPKETVHHKNGIRHDNRIENLELWDSNHGPGQRVSDKIQWYIEFLTRHGYKITKE